MVGSPLLPDRSKESAARTLLETERLILRQFRSSDLDAFCDLYGDAQTMRYMNGVKDREQTRRSLQGKMDHWQERGYGLWCVTRKEDSIVLGHGGLAWLEPLEQVEVAYLIGRSHWGRGYATEVVQASLRYGFQDLGLAQIAAITWPENAASLRVMEKCGMLYWKEVTIWDRQLVCYHIGSAKTD